MERLVSRVWNSVRSYPTIGKLQDYAAAIDAETDPVMRRRHLLNLRHTAYTMHTADSYNMIYESYRIGGRDNFDDYMGACEFYRESKARFWWPRRKVLEDKFHVATQIQQFLDDPEAGYLGISLPPGTGKSTLIKFLIAYVAGEWPDSASIYCSYSDGMVKMMLDAERAILTDTNEYRHNEIFPGLVPDISAEYKTISYRAAGDFPTIGLVSLGGSVTGRTRANKLLITDDLVRNAEEARSPERLNKLYADYKATLTTRTIGEVKQIQLGTIWSVYDPISRMMEEHKGDPRYIFIHIPVMDEEGHSNFLYDCDDRYTDERIADIKKSLDPVDFSCLYMQRPIQREGLAFPEDELMYYETLPEGEPDKKVAFCDVAFGGGDSLSMPIGYVYGEDLYIVDVVFNNGAKDVTEPMVAERLRQHGVHSARFEANNGGDFYAADIVKRLRAVGCACNITTAKAPTTMSKEARIEQYSPDIKRMYFRSEGHRSDEYRKFMNETCIFSYTSKNLHDDAPDSLAGLAAFTMNRSRMITVPGVRPF